MFGGGGFPGALTQRLQPSKSPTEPKSTFPKYDDAHETVRNHEEHDAAKNNLVIIARHGNLKHRIDLYPKTINDWNSKGFAPRTHWLFRKKFEEARQ